MAGETNLTKEQENTKAKEKTLGDLNIDLRGGESDIELNDHLFASTAYKEMVDAYKVILALPAEQRFYKRHKEKYAVLKQKADFYTKEKEKQGISGDQKIQRHGMMEGDSYAEYTPEVSRFMFAKKLSKIGKDGAEICDYVEQRLDDSLAGTNLKNHCGGGIESLTNTAFLTKKAERPDSPHKVESVAKFGELMERAENTVNTYPPTNIATQRVFDDITSPQVVRYLLSVLKNAPDSWFPPDVKEQLNGLALTDLTGLSSTESFKNLRDPKLTAGDLKKLSLITVTVNDPDALLGKKEIKPFAAYAKIADPELKRRAELKEKQRQAEEKRLANANTDPIFTDEQATSYEIRFRQNEGASSPEYKNLETAFRAAVAFNASAELRTPGTGDRLRQALHKAAADYYNAKLSQEQNETRRNRMDLARDLFRATAPEVSRGEQGIAPAEADVDQPAEQPEYEPLTAEQVLGQIDPASMPVEDRDKLYGDILEELYQKTDALYQVQSTTLTGTGSQLSYILPRLNATKSALGDGAYDFVANNVSDIVRAAGNLLDGIDKEKDLKEKALAEELMKLKTPDKMVETLAVRAERNARRETVERYRNMLRDMQQRMKNTNSRFFNRDSTEYKTMAWEVGSMLDFLNGSMLGQNDPNSVIDLASTAFKSQLQRLQNAAAGYYNAKIAQDKNANRQIRFDVAEKLMELPDLDQYRQTFEAQKGEQKSLDADMNLLIKVGSRDLRNAEGVEKFLRDPEMQATFDGSFDKRKFKNFRKYESNLRGAKMVYDLLKKEQESRKILENPGDLSRAKQALARRDVLLGVGLRDYLAEKWTDPLEKGIANKNLELLDLQNIEKLKISLLQKAADVAVREKKIQAELPNFHASGLALVDAPKQPEVKQQPKVEQRPKKSADDYKPTDQAIEDENNQPESKETEIKEQQPEVKEQQPEVKEQQPKKYVSDIQHLLFPIFRDMCGGVKEGQEGEYDMDMLLRKALCMRLVETQTPEERAHTLPLIDVALKKGELFKDEHFSDVDKYEIMDWEKCGRQYNLLESLRMNHSMGDIDLAVAFKNSIMTANRKMKDAPKTNMQNHAVIEQKNGEITNSAAKK